MVVKSVEIDLSVSGDAESKAKLDAIDARAEALKKAFPTYALKVDSAAATSKLQIFRADLKSVADAAAKPVEVQILTAKATAKLDDIRVRADKLKATFPQFAAQIDDRAYKAKLAIMDAEAKVAGARIDKALDVKVTVDDSALQKLQKAADSAKGGGGPAWLGPALALAPAAGTLAGVTVGAAAGIAGAFAAAAGAVGAFGAVAKPVLSAALTAEQAVQTAQDTYNSAIAAGAKQSTAYATEQKAINLAYSELSPAQIALSKQLGDMANGWQNLKAAQTPVVAGALQPWLKAVTDLTSKLGPIIAKVSPVIKDLGVQFDGLINSPAFTAFRDFIAGTGSQAVGAAGGTIIDLVKSFVILLPEFNPLIEKAVGWIGDLGPAVLKWSSSKKAADDITKFMNWFSTNGPVVGGLLKNIGGALKALAPGLSAGGTLELKLISDFFGWVAKLPASIAKPLADVAGTLLILNKLGVFSVGVKFVGLAAGWISKLFSGGAVAELGAAGMQKAGDTMGAAAVAMQRAADTMTGAGVAGKGGAAAGAGEGAAAGGAGVGLGTVVGGAALIAVAIGELYSKITTGKFEDFTQWKTKFLSSIDSMRHAFASFGTGVEQDWDLVWNNTITRTAKGFHDLAGYFDTGRHDIAAVMNEIMSNTIDAWNKTWTQTIGRAIQGGHDVEAGYNSLKNAILVALGAVKSGAATAWSLIWSDTVTKVTNGVRTVATWWHTLQTGAVTAFGIVRTDIANAWNLVWSDTVTKVTNGINTVVNFFKAIPGKITSALGSAGSVLTGWGAGVINGLLAGMTSVIGSVWNFIKGIPGQILKFLGIKSPPQWAIDAGKEIMNGLGIGMTQAQGVFQKASGAAAAAAGAAAAGAMGSGGVSNASGVAALKSAAAKHGWTSAAEWAALNNVEMREAGYSLTATNPSSGAYGMAQFINGPSEYAQYGGNSTTYAGQATAMANYIAQRYGDPIAAWAHEQAYGWYGSGLDAMFSRPTLIGVGERGPERVQVTPGGGGGGDLVAELRALRAELRQLTGVAAAIPAKTGQHVGAVVNGVAAQGSFGRRYP